MSQVYPECKLIIVNKKDSTFYSVYYADMVDIIKSTAIKWGRKCYYCGNFGNRTKKVIDVEIIEKGEGYAGEVGLTSWLGKKLIIIAQRHLLHGRIVCKKCEPQFLEEWRKVSEFIDVKF